MKLTLQKKLAASILRCSEKRIVFDSSKLEDIKEAITKTDMRLLIGEGIVKGKQKKGVSRVRANKNKVQKSKGLRKGHGSRKGKATARESRKDTWMKKVRAQRKFLRDLKEKTLITAVTFKDLYRKSSGGYFRSINHIKLYIKDHELLARKIKEPKQKEIKTVNTVKRVKADKK